MASSFFSSFFSALTFQLVSYCSLRHCIFADKIDKAKEILKVKEDVDILMSQCETYLKEKEEAVQATKNLEESYGQKISELQEELHLKDKQLESCQDQIAKDKDKQKTAYEILRSDWSSDVCSSDLPSSNNNWLMADVCL